MSCYINTTLFNSVEQNIYVFVVVCVLLNAEQTTKEYRFFLIATEDITATAVVFHGIYLHTSQR